MAQSLFFAFLQQKAWKLSSIFYAAGTTSIKFDTPHPLPHNEITITQFSNTCIKEERSITKLFGVYIVSLRHVSQLVFSCKIHLKFPPVCEILHSPPTLNEGLCYLRLWTLFWLTKIHSTHSKVGGGFILNWKYLIGKW